MKDFLAAIEDECTSEIWQRAQRVASKGTMSGKKLRGGGYKLGLTMGAGQRYPSVELLIEEQDWTCENCDTDDGPCLHIAAAAIKLAEELQRGGESAAIESTGGVIAYRLGDLDGALSMQREVHRGSAAGPLNDRLRRDNPPPALQGVELSREDLEIDLMLGRATYRGGTLPSALIERLFTWLSRSDSVFYDDRRIRVSREPCVGLHAVVEDTPTGFLLRGAPDEVERRFRNGALLRDDTLHPTSSPSARHNASTGMAQEDIERLRKGLRFDFDQAAELAGQVLPRLRREMRVDVRSPTLASARKMDVHILFDSELKDGVLSVLPTLVYGDPPSARIDGEQLAYLGQGDLPLRDAGAEQRMRSRLHHELEMRPGARRDFQGEQALDFAARVRGFSGAQQRGDGLKRARVAGPLIPNMSLEGQHMSFEFRESGVVDDTPQEASAEAVVAAWQMGSGVVLLDDGGYAKLPTTWLARHGHLLSDLLAAREANDGAVARSALPDLARMCQALDYPMPPELQRMRVLLESFDKIPASDLPGGVTATLRDYQQRGVDWLRFLRDAGMGAMLADDMGLGKTLQALCALDGRSLVVCPASVLFNWAREIERFRPDLKVSRYHGPRRALDEDADITLTTYAVMRLDVDKLGTVQFENVVLDEAQTIKNPESQVAQAAFQLSGRFRITLTGTPVENRLEDLWSQFHFINPGLLGGRGDFKDRYARPMSEGDAAAGARLRDRIRPFILRRLKQEVAKELPPRTDLVLRCELNDEERGIYGTLLAATREDVVKELQAGGSVMKALEALLRLRQTCCHPALLPAQEHRATQPSSKLQLLRERLEVVAAEGHKALVFSQWTSLLDLIEIQLKAADLRWVRLDGSTRDRGAVVERFQNEVETQVMLLSLKAGGTGLNLTAADHVFLVDPWWNPATEDQAADRAHRIGQDRPVFVHRLVASETVEERILALQARKRALAEAATQASDQAVSLGRQELLALLDG